MHLYDVPVIHPDLRHEETIIQAINSLEYLNFVITDVFDKIDQRIAKNEQRLVDINKRLEISHQKVENLRHTNKAITIYAPAKYPAAKCFADIPMTFGWTDDNTPKASTQQNYQIRSGLVPISHKNVNDKLKFYHVPTQTENLNSKIQNLSEYSRYEDGLGVPPANIDSINALLLFDKAENPYNNYRNAQKTDTAGRVSRMTRSDTSSSVSKMEAAPSSIVNRKLGTKKVVDNLFYTPGLHEAPAIDAPFDLPDLPGIADDISFNVVVNEHAIAPSVSSGGLILPDLPDIEGHAFSMATDSVSAPQTNNGTRDLTTSVIGGENVVDSVPTVPPPPPLPLMVQYHAATPPPPPPPLPPIELLKGADKSTSTLAPKHDNNAARNNLMEAIRLAGGKAKLRAAAVQQAADIRKEAKSTVNSATIVTGGDLMADLHNKLAMRRKGISGAKDSASIPLARDGGTLTKPANVMDRLSAMIPPPPKRQSNSSTVETSDDEWD